MTEKRIAELAEEIGTIMTDEVEWDIIESTLMKCATEQKAIDIEKACKWLQKHLSLNGTGFIKAFQKAMEE